MPLLLLLGSLTAGDASAQSCPGDGSCCEANGTGGCDDVACCEQICALDGFCCFDWDATCAASALTLCAVCSGASCPGPGDCCAANVTPACDDVDCCELVCAQDGSCCSNGWDENCAELALQICPVSTCSGTTCRGVGDCCAANGSPSCESERCCAAVCDQDPFCCDTTWDDQCATLAQTVCAARCIGPAIAPAVAPWGRLTMVLVMIAAGSLLAWGRPRGR